MTSLRTSAWEASNHTSKDRTIAQRESDLFITSIFTDRVGITDRSIIKITISEKRKLAK